MTKSFSTEFRYKEGSYQALVTIKPKGKERAVYVYVTDERLHTILPDGEVNFTIGNNFTRALLPAPTQKAQLLSSIREAVLKHLKDHSAAYEEL